MLPRCAVGGERDPRSPFDPGERAELQRQGAKAAARGDGRDANPLLLAVNRPQCTGEGHRLWSARRDAWAEGFDAQSSATTPRRVVSLLQRQRR